MASREGPSPRGGIGSRGGVAGPERGASWDRIRSRGGMGGGMGGGVPSP